jgi:ATP-dependent Lon protease
MQPAHTYDTGKKIVIPLFEIVVYPNSRTKFQVDRATGELLLAGIKDPESAFAVGLTLKSGTRTSEVTSESLYTTGNLFRISHVQPADHGYLICAEVVQRVTVVSLSEKGGRFYLVDKC